MQPHRAAALVQLERFLPHAAQAYAARRNHDLGQTSDNVSHLSPYIRHRMLLETEVLQAVLQKYSLEEAEKFIQEVCWRTYWKGWLALRPQVWQDYLRALRGQQERLEHQRPFKKAYQEAVEARTGIACFDAWMSELVSTGYLHNHSRMWLASIWIFTLKLPWELGADWFFRHLLDGDPASNTLSWRWVAGLQTAGKHYVATADNIQKFTKNKFFPKKELNESPESLPFVPFPPIQPLQWGKSPTVQPSLLLLTEEDLHAESWLLPSGLPVLGVVAVPCADLRGEVSSVLQDWQTQAQTEALARAAAAYGVPSHFVPRHTLSTLLGQVGAAQFITAQPTVGPVKDWLDQQKLPMAYVCRDWDKAAYPHASKGFFQFKEKIPALVAGW